MTADPTFGQMWQTAAALHDGTPLPSPVPIAPGTGTPLFVVHLASGAMPQISAVADAFRRDRPVYGFESVGAAERRRPPVSVPEIAVRYVAELRRVQPSGPYFITGVCLGGSVAFEMARRIIGAGESVAALVLVNSFRPGIRQLEPGCGLEDIYRRRLERLRQQYRDDLSGKALPELMPVLKSKGLIDTRAVSDDDFYWQQVIFAAKAFAVENYEPRHYPGPAHVFSSATIDGRESADWTPVASQAKTSVLDLISEYEIMTSPEFAAAVAPRGEP
jgi:surfactin synthase thioesterase subunit